MKATFFPTLAEVVELQRVLNEKFGGTGRVHNKARLKRTLLQPKQGDYPSLTHQASSLLLGLLNNSCFTEGNARMSFATTAIFLKMNGFKLRVNARRVCNFLSTEHSDANVSDYDRRVMFDGHRNGSYDLTQMVQRSIAIERVAKWIDDHL